MSNVETPLQIFFFKKIFRVGYLGNSKCFIKKKGYNNETIEIIYRGFERNF